MIRFATVALVSVAFLAAGCENEPCGDGKCRLDETCCQGGCTVDGELRYYCSSSCPPPTDAGCFAVGDGGSGIGGPVANFPLVCELRTDPDGIRPVRFELPAALAAMDGFVATVSDVRDDRLFFEAAGAGGELVWVGPRLPEYFSVGEEIDVAVTGLEVASRTRPNRVGWEEIGIPGTVAGAVVLFGEPACTRSDTIVRYCAAGIGPSPDLDGSELHYVFFFGAALTAPFSSATDGDFTVTNVEAIRDPPPGWDCLGMTPGLTGAGLFSYAYQ